ncbi:MAG: ABC transporter permease [Candidatus Bipolaricaulota bacterium]|nr:ABC transporter permease [Candidatus Bipolaricaulota bacterium]
MLAYIGRRMIIMPFVLVGILLIIFGMLQLLSPQQKLATFIKSPAELKNNDVEVLIEKYGLNDPIWARLGRWLNDVIHFNFGYSESASMPAAEAFLQFFPVSMELALWSALPIILGGIWLGTVAAVNHNNVIDHVTRVFAIVGWSLPSFVAGLLLLMVFYGGLVNWFPPGRLGLDASGIVQSASFTRYTGMNTIDAVLNWNWFVFWDAVKHIILPAIVMSYVRWAMLLRIMRSSLLETLRKDFVTTARSKGLEEGKVIKKHARRNALIPVATIGGIYLAFLINGLVITETIFNWNGLGRWAVRAAQQYDTSSLLLFALFNGVLLVVANLSVDILYAYLDPRVTYD